MIPYESIKWLHVEQTSRCNASCPSCVRNNLGYGVASNFEIKDLSLDRLTEVLDLLPNLETLQYCGVRGDVIAAQNFLESLDIVLSKNIPKIWIHTNGSMKTTAWWERLAVKLKGVDHEVVFALDGLEDTHAIYRQNTDFNKIIENAKAFIACGGKAVWQFIPFAHNQHQILEAIKMSQQLKFSRFQFVHDVRHTTEAYHHQTGLPIDIQPWDRASKNRHALDKRMNNDVVVEDSCMHLTFPSLYLDHTGTLSPCCFLNKFDHATLDIAQNFKDKKWMWQCLEWCGSKSCAS